MHLATRYLPAFFHNLKGYGGHFIIREVYIYIYIKKLETSRSAQIPNSNENSMSFKIGDMKFIDSYAFLRDSINKAYTTNKCRYIY